VDETRPAEDGWWEGAAPTYPIPSQPPGSVSRL
jgi:hypothetical protein